MSQSALELAQTIITISAAIGILSGFIITLVRISNGIKCLLRADMLSTYYRHNEDKTIRQYEMENFEHEYNAYKALHGNSFIDNIADVVRNWEVIS